MISHTYTSPLGPITITESEGAITGLIFGETPDSCTPPTALLSEAVRQLQEYFSGRRKEFSLPVFPAGTAFQRAVWQILLTIPYGKTCSYGDIAAMIGRPTAVRAAAQAIGHNPISILIPCHRVIGKDGSLTGYAWGISIKEQLLKLEQT